MKLTNSLVALLASASIAGCSTSSSHDASLPLAATRNNAGQIANVSLASVGDKTDFDFYISGVPDGTTLPLRIYTFVHKGSCQQPGPVAYAMNDKVNTESDAGTRGWTFYRSAPVAMQELLSGKYALVVRTAPEDGNLDIFCGDIAQATH
ncbi:hypothetical protein D3C76_136800 [compost metagenome]